MQELVARAMMYEMTHPARMREGRGKPYGTYGTVGELVLNLPEEERNLLKGLTVEDASDVRLCDACWFRGAVPEQLGYRSRYRNGLIEVYSNARKEFERREQERKFAKP